MDAREIAKLAVNALEDKKAQDIKVIDISEISTIADYFIWWKIHLGIKFSVIFCFT